jgi:DNA-binding Lrp family transcriptional regulator
MAVRRDAPPAYGPGLPRALLTGYYAASHRNRRPWRHRSAEETCSMVNAIVLIRTTHGQINDVAEALAEIREISEVYSVGGSCDVIAIIRVRNNEDIADLVTQKMVNIEGIERTETMIAFKAYSRHDLEAVFSVGLDD